MEVYVKFTCICVSLITLNIPENIARRLESDSGRIWSDCTSPSSPVHLTRLNIEPRPVSLPGDLLFTLEGYTNRTLGSSALHLDIVREGSWFNIPIPCFRKIGSCTYDDMCTMLEEMISDNWMGITRTMAMDIKQMLINNGLQPGLCPQPPQSIRLNSERIRLPRMPAALYWFAEGVYRANVRITDNNSGEELVCFDFRIAVEQRQEECSGFWGCLFN